VKKINHTHSRLSPKKTINYVIMFLIWKQYLKLRMIHRYYSFMDNLWEKINDEFINVLNKN